MKLNFKKITKKKIVVGVLTLVLVLVWILVMWWMIDIFVEWDKVKIDVYNFQQLEKAKPILKSLPKDAEKFYNLREFNEQYKANIKSIKNCYYISNRNGKESFIFWFQLESDIYKLLYWNIYVYPKYDLPIDEICTSKCEDINRPYFERIISNPCKD